MIIEGERSIWHGLHCNEGVKQVRHQGNSVLESGRTEEKSRLLEGSQDLLTSKCVNKLNHANIV